MPRQTATPRRRYQTKGCASTSSYLCLIQELMTQTSLARRHVGGDLDDSRPTA